MHHFFFFSRVCMFVHLNETSNESVCIPQLACTTLEVDIIVLNMTAKLPFYIKRPLVHLVSAACCRHRQSKVLREETPEAGEPL